MDSEEPKKSFKSDYSPLHRLVALSFIALIVFGNIWMARFILKAEPQEWVRNGFMISVVCSFIFGAALAIQLLLQYFGVFKIPSSFESDDPSSEEN